MVYFYLVMITLSVLSSVFYKQIIGKAGEFWTKQELNKLPKDEYKIINDLFVRVNGKTHQIDHVVVSKYGIFVIETKQYNGYIKGDKYDKYWVRYTKNNKYYYLNPIRQNYGHIKAISELLNIDESKVFNIVCIPSKAKLKIQHDGELTRNYTIVERIRSYKDTIIYDVDGLESVLNNNNIKNKNIRNRHNKNIRINIADKDRNKCPRCGGDLVLRTGKYGAFYGCSKYPKCRYIRNNK